MASDLRNQYFFSDLGWCIARPECNPIEDPDVSGASRCEVVPARDGAEPEGETIILGFSRFFGMRNYTRQAVLCRRKQQRRSISNETLRSLAALAMGGRRERTVEEPACSSLSQKLSATNQAAPKELEYPNCTSDETGPLFH